MVGVADKVREAGASFAEVFRNRELRRLNLALAGSVVGDWALAVAVGVYAFTRGGATTLGVLGVVRYLSMALAAPFAATLADRYSRKAVMIGADLVRLVLVVVGAAVIVTDGPSFAVYGLAVLTAVAGTAFSPAQAALLPSLARHPAELTAANVVASTVDSLGFFAGPAMAGLLLAVAGVTSVYVFDALTFLWSVLVVAGIRVPARSDASTGTEASAETDGSGEGQHKVSAGFRAIAGDRDLRLVVSLLFAQVIVAGASLVFGVAIALDLLGLGEGGPGLLDAVLGVGGLVGGFVALVLAQRRRLAFDFGIGVVLWSLPLVLVTISPTLGAALLAMALIGLGNSLVDINAHTILQRIVPTQVMGRVFGALESLAVAGMALGSLLMPLLIHTVGLRAGLAIIGGGATAVVLVGMAGLRRIDREVLAVPGTDLLRAVPFFAPLPEGIIERLARTSTLVPYLAGAVVITEGEPGDRFYVIESGSVRVTIDGEHVRDLGPGDSFGEVALLRDVPRTATVQAISELVVRAIDRDEFLPAVTGHGGAAATAQSVMERLRLAR